MVSRSKKIKSIITDDLEHCMICGSPDVVMHHAIGGTAGRRLSDEDKLIIPLCPYHHNMSTHDSVHLNSTIEKWSCIVGQLAWEAECSRRWGCEDQEYIRKEFRKRYGKSFL